MKTDPLVTIVISVYNKAPYVAQAIESVLNQTYRNLDVIVVDDGSTDSSREVIQKYEGQPRFRFYSQPNSGVASCRNRGLSDSAGEFIVFLDGDDYFYPDYIETAVVHMERHPSVDLLYVAWDTITQDGTLLSLGAVYNEPDYLRTLLLGNIFAPHALFCRTSFLKKVGLFDFYTVTDDWEYWIRCAKSGGHFEALNKRFVAYRKYQWSNKMIKAKQQLRFFPIIDKVFHPAYGLPESYRALEPLSRIRHHFFLLENYAQWGWKNEAREQFQKALNLIRTNPTDWRQYAFILRILSLSQLFRLSLAQLKRGAPRQVMAIWLFRLNQFNFIRGLIRQTAGVIYRLPKRLEAKIQRSSFFLGLCADPPYGFEKSTTIHDIAKLTLSYLQRQRVMRAGKFSGYRYSDSTSKPVLYATFYALLTKHLYGVRDRGTDEEIEYALGFQDNDGLFRDPAIACAQADGAFHGWGWRHLTLHALMTLALYDKPCRKELRLVEPYDHPDHFRRFLESREWTKQAAATGNELQNIGVLLQYARDYQNSKMAAALMEVMYDVIDSHQDPQTGLYGNLFHTPAQLSDGVISAYHLWLLYFYDNRPISYVRQILDSLLLTQNTMGGYGVRWNSSACEDIDSIDPLARFSKKTSDRSEAVQSSLRRALPAVLRNLNGDGGWVFRRHEAKLLIHPQMFSAKDESNMFCTWFRTLALAYVLTALRDVPPELQYGWQFKKAPGHQFSVAEDVSPSPDSAGPEA